VRALDTARACGEALALPVEEDERLLEFGSGGITPFTLEGMLEHLPYDDIWHPDDPAWDGETIGAFWRRTAAVAGDVVDRGGRPLVVSHGGTTTGILRALLGIGHDVPDFFHFVVDNASLTEVGFRLDRHGRRRVVLQRLNETGFLSRVTGM
jgi:broad specificity phosphatase PhoE